MAFMCLVLRRETPSPTANVYLPTHITQIIPRLIQPLFSDEL